MTRARTGLINLDVPKGNYDHASQVSTYKNMKLALPTFGGTQTYDYSGKPFDNDSD
jgi:hypothetical protein